MFNSELIEQPKSEKRDAFSLSDKNLIDLNNELINKLINEIHYLMTEVMDHGRILRMLNDEENKK